jgi:hypothetical protein
VGNNLSALGILRKFRSGKPKNELLRAYDRHDYTARATRMALWRASVLHGQATGEGEPAPFDPAAFERSTDELREAVRLACAAGVQVKAYWTPSHAAIVDRAIDQTAMKMAVWRQLAALRPQCPAGLAYHDFNHPNLVSLDGVLDGAPQGRYFRSDGHPRPTVGQLMTRALFGRPAPGQDPQDFGQIDLMRLSADEAQAWIALHEARWRGEWTPEDLRAFQDDVARTQAHGAPDR